MTLALAHCDALGQKLTAYDLGSKFGFAGSPESLAKLEGAHSTWIIDYNRL